MPRAKISKERRKEIADYLQEGNSQHSAIKKFKISANVVHQVREEYNIVPAAKNKKMTEDAREARQYYTKENRIKAWDKIFGMCVARFNDEKLSAFAFQKLVIALATATDKLRLEEDSGDKGKAAILDLMNTIKNST